MKSIVSYPNRGEYGNNKYRGNATGKALLKFHSDDWGILCNEDKEFQNELLKNTNSKYEYRFMGVYMINEHKIWIMSEYDYSIKSLLITILLPEEY